MKNVYCGCGRSFFKLEKNKHLVDFLRFICSWTAGGGMNEWMMLSSCITETKGRKSSIFWTKPQKTYRPRSFSFDHLKTYIYFLNFPVLSLECPQPLCLATEGKGRRRHCPLLPSHSNMQLQYIFHRLPTFTVKMSPKESCLLFLWLVELL